MATTARASTEVRTREDDGRSETNNAYDTDDDDAPLKF